jgi:hypothetical protein
MEGERLVFELSNDQPESVQATGRALMLTSGGDSLNAPDTPEIARRDRLEGDSILAVFSTPEELESPAGSAPPPAADPLPPADPAQPPSADSVSAPAVDPAARAAVPDSLAPDGVDRPRAQLQFLVARGNARALYRMPPGDTTNASDPACSRPGRFAIHLVVGDTITISMRDGTVEEMQVIGQVSGTHLEPPECTPAAASPAGTPGDPAVEPAPPLPGGGAAPPPGPASAALPPWVSQAAPAPRGFRRQVGVARRAS